MGSLSKLETRKLELLRTEFGAMSADEALALALDTEQIKRALGPFDPAYGLFSQRQSAMETMAELLEREQS